MRYALKELKS